MRKSSVLARSLGVVPVGITLLLLPVYAVTVGALGAPSPGWAAEEPAAPAAIPVPGETAPAARPDSGSAVKEVLQRRQSWLDRVRMLASRRLARPRRRAVARNRVLKVIHTRATWYGPGFHGRRTASGERFNRNAMTLASRHLPFGTKVRVTNLRTGRAVVGRVNDRGPFRRGYTADLSQGMARRIGMGGSAPVRLEILPRK